MQWEKLKPDRRKLGKVAVASSWNLNEARTGRHSLVKELIYVQNGLEYATVKFLLKRFTYLKQIEGSTFDKRLVMKLLFGCEGPLVATGDAIRRGLWAVNGKCFQQRKSGWTV